MKQMNEAAGKQILGMNICMEVMTSTFSMHCISHKVHFPFVVYTMDVAQLKQS